MNDWLHIETHISNECEFQAIDKSRYEEVQEIKDYVFIDFLVYNDDTYLYTPNRFVSIVRNGGWYGESFHFNSKLDKDGKFTYYKYGIRTLESFEIIHPDDEVRPIAEEWTYPVKNQIFYYQNKVFIGKFDENSVDDVIASSEEITNLFDLKNYIEQIRFYFDTTVINICNLKNCLLSLQKELIDLKLSSKCNNDSDIQDKKDFMLSSVFVLEYLISIKKYEEAVRLIDRLSSCNFICKSNKLSCNCGTTI